MPGAANDTFVYFAYGSNMLTRRLRASDRAPSAKSIGVGFVEGRKLTFDKLGRDGSGKCDMESSDTGGDRVYGVLFRLARHDRAALDRVEGLGAGYADRRIRVVTGAGACDALSYVATMKAPGLRPFHWYKALVVAGAMEHGLPDRYVDWLKTFRSREDADDNRRKAHEAILAGN